MVIQKRMKSGKTRSVNFNDQTSTQNYGEPSEFEWNVLRRFTSMEILRQIQQDLKHRQINPEQPSRRILFMSMFNDID